MANEMFYVKIETSRDITVYGFSRSATGILDFVDGASAKDEELSQMQCVDGSAYFTPSWYMFLPKDLQATINVYLPSDVKNLDVGQYSFLLHVGALLLAVDERDGLLVAELLRRRVTVFSSFLPLVLHLIKPVAAEALFAYVYGGFRGDSNFSQIYKANVPIATGETDVSAILLEAAKDALKPNPEKESPEEMFIRYFREKEFFDFTIGLVGATNHPWIAGIEKYESVVKAATAFRFFDDAAVGAKSQEFFESLSTKVQAEPYNPHDHNAISVSIDDLGAKLKGLVSKSKAGYLRATGAAILRKARPNMFAYDSKLWRLGADPSFFENSIVVRIHT
ncbi:hypothetical protein B7990_01670 [Fibrobacter sp. UWB4]|uniref:hypothetical protein n=1 Tax=Fibrobacter sp. UWB4 TaxID=1964356 RepID=UPI000B523C2D|nr:hypothetical protein [Fibrobacter sp. UWB4]OWV19905.1 hypothetical protein B7990_01670 [Fibrobacter sp. UWB4]